MVNTTMLKQLLGLVFVTSLMVGCSSTPEEDTTMDDDMSSSTADTGSVTNTPVTSEAPPPAPVIDKVFYFEFDSSVLNASARAALTAHASQLKNNSKRVRLEGHADERGTREYNQALGARRANAAADYLVLQGVSRSRIETVSYGEESPAMMGSNESSWSKNRRVELK